MSKIEKLSNMFITLGAGMLGGSIFMKNFFFTVDAGL
jgi:hypothetical protein